MGATLATDICHMHIGIYCICMYECLQLCICICIFYYAIHSEMDFGEFGNSLNLYFLPAKALDYVSCHEIQTSVQSMYGSWYKHLFYLTWMRDWLWNLPYGTRRKILRHVYRYTRVTKGVFAHAYMRTWPNSVDRKLHRKKGQSNQHYRNCHWQEYLTSGYITSFTF